MKMSGETCNNKCRCTTVWLIVKCRLSGVKTASNNYLNTKGCRLYCRFYGVLLLKLDYNMYFPTDHDWIYKLSWLKHLTCTVGRTRALEKNMEVEKKGHYQPFSEGTFRSLKLKLLRWIFFILRMEQMTVCACSDEPAENYDYYYYKAAVLLIVMEHFSVFRVIILVLWAAKVHTHYSPFLFYLFIYF